MHQGQRVSDVLQHLIEWHKEGAPLSRIVALMVPQAKPQRARRPHWHIRPWVLGIAEFHLSVCVAGLMLAYD